MRKIKTNRLYSIEIKEPSKKRPSDASCNTEKYTVFFCKNYGNMYGGVFSCETIKYLKESLQNIVKQWEEFDSILNRMSENVTKRNLYFESFTSKISVSDVLGIQTLNDWMM